MATVSLAILGVTVLGWLLAMNMVLPLMQQSFRERSLAYVQAFSSSAAPWVDPLQPAMLQSASRFMLVGSAQYVQIVIQDEVIADERSESFSSASLPVLEPEMYSNRETTAARDRHVLDIAVPLFPGRGLEHGYVRMGIDSSSVIHRARMIAIWSAALGLGVDILLVGLLWWLLGFRLAVSSKHASEDNQTSSGQQITVGELQIDAARRQILFKGTRLSCTPKQYALLAFLASEPDRVFTDREIVTSVWKESSYADSKDVKQYVYLVRRKLAAIHPTGRLLIETVPGFGYRLVSQIVDRELTDE